jgi:hypothetical protein
MYVANEAFAQFDWVGCLRSYVENGGMPASRSSRVTVSQGDGQSSRKYERTSKVASFGRNQGIDDDESQPSDDEPGEGPKSQKFSPLLRFACPFHQYDPLKYSPNNLMGIKYRSCAGPGFKTIAKVK